MVTNNKGHTRECLAIGNNELNGQLKNYPFYNNISERIFLCIAVSQLRDILRE